MRSTVWEYCQFHSSDDDIPRATVSALVVDNELGETVATGNQGNLLLKRDLPPELKESPPDVHHLGVCTIDGGAFDENEGCIPSGEKPECP